MLNVKGYLVRGEPQKIGFFWGGYDSKMALHIKTCSLVVCDYFRSTLYSVDLRCPVTRMWFLSQHPFHISWERGRVVKSSDY